MSQDNKQKGVIYCSFQTKKFQLQSLISSIQFALLNPEVPITILTDSIFCQDSRLNDMNISINQIIPKGEFATKFDSRKIKTNIYDYSPYATTLYIDVDILPLKPCSELWDISDNNDFAMVEDMWASIAESDYASTPEGLYTLNQYSPELKLFNGGLMLFNKTEPNSKLLKTWTKEWKKYKLYDQFALVRSIHDTKTDVYILENRFNTLVNGNIKIPLGDIVFLHLLKHWLSWEATIDIYKVMAPEAYSLALDIFKLNDEQVLNIM